MPEAKGFDEQTGSPQVSSKLSKSQRSHFHLRDALLDSLSEAMVATDRRGRILAANQAWMQFHRECSWLSGIPAGGEGNARIVLHKERLKKACEEADLLFSGLRRVAGGSTTEFEHEFSMLHGGKRCCFRLFVKALSEGSDGFMMIILRDITAQRQAEEDLRESYALFDRITESTGDGIFMCDPQGRFLMHNAAGTDMLGVPSSKIVGKTIEEIFPPKLAQMIREQNELVLATGRSLGYELVLDTPEGKRTALVQKGIYRNHQNKAVGIIGISRDITERKLAEEKLKRNEHHFRVLIEKSADAITLLAQDGAVIYVSPPCKGISGFEPDEIVGTNIFFWIHPDDLPACQQRFQELLQLPGASVNGEFRHLCKDGRWKWMETTSTNWLHDPSVGAIVVNGRDVSERKAAEQELQRVESIVEFSIDGIFSIDLEMKITSWNPAAHRIFGYSETEVFGKNVSILIPQEHLKESAELLAQCYRGKPIRDFETVRLRRDGQRIEVSMTISPIRDPRSCLTGLAVIVRDISERRRLEKEVLEIADFEKHRIGQDLHDDLCQHLVGISMIGNLLYAELAGLGLKQAEDAKQVTELIRNAVDHARILAKGLSPLNVAQGGLMAGLEALVANTEQMFRFPCYFECPAPLHLEDPDVTMHLYRIAQEALHNAVKHSQGTKAIVRFEAIGDAVVVTVTNDGLCPPEPQKRSEGSGMGMHTMYYRSRIIGATLEISPNPGGGTRVVCRLPSPKLANI